MLVAAVALIEKFLIQSVIVNLEVGHGIGALVNDFTN